jgi:hypothetical protein
MPPNTLPGQTTLGILRGLIAKEAQQPPPTAFTNITIADYDAFINRSFRKATQLLVNSFQDYYVNPDNGNPYTFRTDGRNWLYPLPNDFAHLLGVDCLQTPGQIQTAVTCSPFMNGDRNALQQTYAPTGGVWAPPYKISGNQIWLLPMPPPAALEIFIRYVPLLPDMADVGTITFDSIPGVGDSITIGAQSTIPQGPPENGVLPDLARQVQYVAIANGQTPIDTDAVVQFHRGLTTAEAASNLYDAFLRVNGGGSPSAPWSTGSAAQDRRNVQASVSDNVITLQLFAPLAIVWFTTASGGTDRTTPAQGMAVDPCPPATQWNPYAAWFNFNGILNGFDELVIVDVCTKIKEAQRQDSTPFIRRMEELTVELRTNANNRNAAQPQRITRVRRGGWGPGGWGGPGVYGGR